jgi:hypothetical protein
VCEKHTAVTGSAQGVVRQIAHLKAPASDAPASESESESIATQGIPNSCAPSGDPTDSGQRLNSVLNLLKFILAMTRRDVSLQGRAYDGLRP